MRHRIAVLAFALLVWSCGFGPLKKRPSFGPRIELRAEAARTANLNSPVAVDLVLVFDKRLVEELLAMPAETWFARRFQFERDSVGKRRLEFQSWEWTPGQTMETEVRYSRKGWAAILYARYLAPGEHRARIDPLKRFRLLLGEETFEVVPVQP